MYPIFSRHSYLRCTEVLHICCFSVPEYQVSVRVALRTGNPCESQAILRQIHGMIPICPWTLKGQIYSIYVLLLLQTPKFQSVSLYGYFETIVPNDPKMTLSTTWSKVYNIFVTRVHIPKFQPFLRYITWRNCLSNIPCIHQIITPAQGQNLVLFRYSTFYFQDKVCGKSEMHWTCTTPQVHVNRLIQPLWQIIICILFRRNIRCRFSLSSTVHCIPRAMCHFVLFVVNTPPCFNFGDNWRSKFTAFATLHHVLTITKPQRGHDEKIRLSRAQAKSLQFLALLDYVSRAHEIAICPSSVVRPSSVVCRPSVRVAIISELNARKSFKF